MYDHDDVMFKESDQLEFLLLVGVYQINMKGEP